MINFTILITTKNRLTDLKYSLKKLDFDNSNFHCIICDDGSSDGTFNFLKENYPTIQTIRNNKSKGLIYSRNRLMTMVTTPYAISLDDDANILVQNPFQMITYYFEQNPQVGVLGFRVFWSKKNPESINHNETPHRMQSFIGGAHAWRMDSWRQIPEYPSWFEFYGEEDFASYHLFKNKIEIHYLPDVLVHHRVDIKSRKKNPDYLIRSRRSLRAGWFLILMFFPVKKIAFAISYSVYAQFKSKVFKGDFKAFFALILAFFDLIFNIPNIFKFQNRLSKTEYNSYKSLPETKIYWTLK
jgi:glycosyltransferase involved in cell wall biosynthesis